MSSRTVRAELDGRGVWMIDLSDQREPVVCEALEEAQRAGYLCAAQRHPCELLVRDAYHRVLFSKLISRDGDAGVRDEAAGDGQSDGDGVGARRQLSVSPTGAD